MMFVTSKHVLQIKKCRNLLKNYDLFSAVPTFWFYFKVEVSHTTCTAYAPQVSLTDVSLQALLYPFLFLRGTKVGGPWTESTGPWTRSKRGEGGPLTLGLCFALACLVA